MCASRNVLRTSERLMVLPSASAGAGHVFCVSRCTDRDCCGNGGGARVENDHFLPNHHGGFAQNGHFRSSTAVEIGKILIFCRPPRWKCPPRSFLAKNRGGNRKIAHILPSTAVETENTAIFRKKPRCSPSQRSFSRRPPRCSVPK